MLHLTTANPVSWPTPPSNAVPAVPAIVAVQAMQGVGRDPQADLGPGQQRRPSQGSSQGISQEVPLQEGAPLLPRAAGEAGSALGQLRSPAADAAARKAAEAAAAELAEQQASAKEEIHQRLQEALSSTWQASAAVVDRALGRPDRPELSVGEAATALAQPARRPMLVRESPAPLPTLQPITAPAPAPAVALPGETSKAATGSTDTVDLVAYDERGNGSVQTREAGGLLDRRV